MTESIGGPQGVWLYAVTRTDIAADDLGAVRGVAGELVRVIRTADLAAVVGTVGLDEFGEAPLRRNMEDLDWLAATARAHDAVIGAVVRCGPTLPLRLATLYVDDDRVATLLADRRPEFAAILSAVTGRSEWGVKAYGDRRAIADAAATTNRSSDPAHKGREYLRRRRAELDAREQIERKAAAHVDAIHAALLHLANNGKLRAATDPVLTGKRGWMILNATYLVDDERAHDFAALVEELRAGHAGVTLELTGPWPPYSFTELHQAAP